jgi:hypothetical protein
LNREEIFENSGHAQKSRALSYAEKRSVENVSSCPNRS